MALVEKARREVSEGVAVVREAPNDRGRRWIANGVEKNVGRWMARSVDEAW